MSVDDDEPKKPNFPGVWGAGYQAGYADCLAGKPNGRTIMNRKKIERMKRGMTAMAMKVYNCVPMNESWDKSKIHAEMHRQGMTHNAKVIDGCLNNLRGVGLIKEPASGAFIQITPSKPGRPRKTQVSASQMPLDEHKPTEKPKETHMTKSPIDIMFGLNAKMDAVKTAMDDLQNEFDTAALEVAEVMDKASKDLAKLHQLQALLKGISSDE